MTNKKSNNASGNGPELAIFTVGELNCAVDSTIVKAINKYLEITPVPGAPDCVRGILNLRGQILTVVDLRRRFGLGTEELRQAMRIVVITSRDENIGLLVDGVSDVVIADPDLLEPPPSNIGEVEGKFFTSILKTEQDLIAILDVEEILSLDESAISQGN